METVLRVGEEAEDGVLLQVMRIPSLDSSQSHETVLWDSACTGRFVRHGHAKKMKFPYEEKKLRVTTLGGVIQEIDGVVYTCSIKDQTGKVHSFKAHGLDEVTGVLGKPISKGIMKQMFPDVVGVHKLAGASSVDYLLGLGDASWQPQRVQKAQGGGDFWLWKNQFGTCIGGSHPLVDSLTSRSSSLYTVMKVITENIAHDPELKIPTCTSFFAKASISDSSDFFRSEQLGTTIEPKCGACRCGKCPVPGSRFSFREETELRMIDENLVYDEAAGSWVATYLYLFHRETLKGNKTVAFKSMEATEKMLSRKGE